MKKNWLTAAFIMALLFGLNACSTIVPGKIVYSDKLQGTIDDLKNRGVNVKVAVFVSDQGQLLFYDKEGKKLKKCTLPKPGAKPDITKKKAAQMQDPTQCETPEGVCKGMYYGSAVTAVQTLPIIKTNSHSCMTFGPDSLGYHYQFCW